MSQLLKKRICSHRSKFFPLRVDCILVRLRCPGKQTGSQEKLSPFENIAENGSLAIHFKVWVHTHVFPQFSTKLNNFLDFLFAFQAD